MTEPNEKPGTEEKQPQPSEVEKLRAQFTEQFQTQKEAFESQISKLTEENKGLQKHVEELQRSLVRAAVTSEAPREKEPEKTDEELYQEDVDRLAQRVLERQYGTVKQ